MSRLSVFLCSTDAFRYLYELTLSCWNGSWTVYTFFLRKIWSAFSKVLFHRTEPIWPWAWPCWNCTGSYKFSVSVKKMGEGWTGGASDIVKVKSSGEDPRATGGLVSNLPHPRVNKTKQHKNKNAWYGSTNRLLPGLVEMWNFSADMIIFFKTSLHFISSILWFHVNQQPNTYRKRGI